MQVEISDMIAFVDRLSKLDLPQEDEGDSVKLSDLRDDTAREEDGACPPLFDGYIKVDKVHGV